MQNPAADLALNRVESDEAGLQHVRFDQVVHGVPVFGGQLIVHLQGDRVVAVNGNYFPSVQVDTTPTVGQDASVALVRADIGDPQAELRADRSALVVYMDEGHPHLAWKVNVYSEKNLGNWLYFVDAHDNRIVHRLNQLDTAKSLKVYDMNHSSSTGGLPGTLVCGAGTGNPLCGSPADLDAQSAYTNTSKVYDYYKNVFGRLSYDDYDAELESSVHFSNNYFNAFWNGQQMVYGDGDTFAQAFDVIAHELTHGVTEYTSNLIYEHQPGALNESWSDVMAVFAGCSSATGKADCNWLMGDTLSGGAIRNLSDPPLYGDPDHMSAYRWLPLEDDNGGVHSNSGIPNKAAYLLTAGGTFHGVTTTGIGYLKAEQIYYRAMKNYLTTYSDFGVTRAALQQSCRDLIGLYGITAGNCDQVLNAWAAVGVGSRAVTIPSAKKIYLPGVMRNYPPVSCSPSGILANGNFEAGTANWTQQSSSGYSIITQQHPRDGTWSAWLGGYDNAADVLYQTIKIPAGRTALQVSFYVHVYSKDDLNSAYDKLYASIQPVSSVISPQEVWTVDNTYASSVWWHVTLTYNELPYAGQTARLYLRGKTDGSLYTNFFVDTASVQVTCSRYAGLAGTSTAPSITIEPVNDRPAMDPLAAAIKR